MGCVFYLGLECTCYREKPDRVYLFLVIALNVNMQTILIFGDRVVRMLRRWGDYSVPNAVGYFVLIINLQMILIFEDSGRHATAVVGLLWSETL